VDGTDRIVQYPPLSKAEARDLTPSGLLAGEDHWNPMAAVRALRKLKGTEQ